MNIIKYLLICAALLAALAYGNSGQAAPGQEGYVVYMPYLVKADFASVTQTPTSTTTPTLTATTTPTATNTSLPTMTATTTPTMEPTNTATATPEPLTLLATADSFTTSGRPDRAWEGINPEGGCLGYDEQEWHICAIFVRFDNQSLINQFNLERAILGFTARNCFYCEHLVVDVCPVTSDWNQATITWATMPEIAPEQFCSTGVLDPSSRYVNIDITRSLEYVLRGDLPDYGFRVTARTERDWWFVYFHEAGNYLAPREELWGLPAKR